MIDFCSRPQHCINIQLWESGQEGFGWLQKAYDMVTNGDKLWGVTTMLGSPLSNQRRSIPNITTFIQGGKSLSEKLAKMMVDKKPENCELVKLTAAKVTKSAGVNLSVGNKALSASIQPSPPVVNTSKIKGLLLQIHYLLYINNMLKYRQVQVTAKSHSAENIKMKRRVQQQQEEINNLNERIGKLEIESNVNQMRQVRLQQQVDNQAKLLCTALQETQRTLYQHTAMIEKQQDILQRLIDGGLQDSVVDVGCLVTTIQLTQHPLLKLVTSRLHLAISLYWPTCKHRRKGRSIVKVIVFIQVFLLLRAISHKLQLSTRFWCLIYRTYKRSQNQVFNLFKTPISTPVDIERSHTIMLLNKSIKTSNDRHKTALSGHTSFE